MVTTAKYVPGATLRARARTSVAPAPDPQASSVVGSPHAPSSATATSVDEVLAHTSRSTLAPGATVIAATTFCDPAGEVTLHDVVNVSFAPTVESA